MVYHGPSVTGPSRAQFLLPKPLLDKIIDVYGAYGGGDCRG